MMSLSICALIHRRIVNGSQWISSSQDHARRCPREFFTSRKILLMDFKLWKITLRCSIRCRNFIVRRRPEVFDGMIPHLTSDGPRLIERYQNVTEVSQISSMTESMNVSG